MSLRLILGRAGSGKSTHIYREINRLVADRPDGPPLWLLVPEQATSQAERNLADGGVVPGLMRARVVSFQRLAYQSLHEVGGAALVQISELGRRMILRHVLEEKKQELRIFYRSVNQPGFAGKLAELITELKSYQVTPADLAAVLDASTESLPPTLYDKLHDLALVFDYLEQQYGDTYLDAGDCLRLLETNLPQMQSLVGSPIWLDGFTGFTGQEYAVIAQLLQVCPQVSISLTLPPALLRRRLRDNDVFYTPWETAQKLMRLAADLKVGIEETVVPATVSQRCQANQALHYLEANYFDRLAPPWSEQPTGLKVVAASNRRAEVEAAAGEILRLCREEGYRYRDISITLRDFSAYDYLLTTVLDDYQIPHFLDQKRTVDQHPALELVRAGLDCVLENFLYEPVFRCLKTDLFSVSRDEVDVLENYVLAAGVRGLNRWLEEDDWPPRAGLAAEQATTALPSQETMPNVNRLRRQVGKYLGDLAIALQSATTVRGYTEAVYRFLATLKVNETLLDWADQAAAAGQLEAASLHTQVWEALIQLLDELVASLGEEELPLAEYARIVSSGLEAIELGLIPPELDQVVITSLGRSRNPEVKAALVLGVSEGVLPARIPVEGLFTDYERQLLADLQVELGPSTERRLFDEQFLVYTAISRASHQLWLSYPLADEEGATLLPSPVIKRVLHLFPQLEEEQHPLGPENLVSAAVLPYLAHPQRALLHLAVQLREAALGRPVTEIWWDVYTYLLQTPTQRPALLRVLASLEQRNIEDRLPSHLVRRLYGSTLRASISRLERYNACPFAYFAAYGLRLQERAVYRLAAPDLGNFFHDAMDIFVQRLHQRGLDWGELDDNEYTELTQEIVDDLRPQLQNHILDSSSRLQHIARKLQRTVERSARVLGRHARAGKFRPVAAELSFGPHGNLPGLTFSLPDGTKIELAGRIDRLDVATVDEQSYLRIIDYKSGSANLTPMEVYYGLKLQLLTYLYIALLYSDDALPAGALYFRIHDPLQTVEKPLSLQEAQALALESYRMSGLLVDDVQAIRLMHEDLSGKSLLIPVSIKKDGTPSRGNHIWSKEELEQMRHHLTRLLLQTGQEIVGGNIAIAPYRLQTETACRFCPYRGVCQFDALLPENSYRWLPRLSRQEVFAQLQQPEGGDEA